MVHRSRIPPDFHDDHCYNTAIIPLETYSFAICYTVIRTGHPPVSTPPRDFQHAGILFCHPRRHVALYFLSTLAIFLVIRAAVYVVGFIHTGLDSAGKHQQNLNFSLHLLN